MSTARIGRDRDGASWPIRGLIEGFYGPPWSWDDRRLVSQECHARGMTHYVYAPKDDPLHRDRWREPYPSATLDEFAQLAGADTLALGFGISPGLSIDYEDLEDRLALAAKIDQVVAAGVGLVCLALDDIPIRPGLGEHHAALTAWLHDHLGDRASLLLVPTEYTGDRPTPYLDALAVGVPDDVPIAWTGRTVVTDRLTAAEARKRAASIGGRPPLIWDNYPVNDAIMADRLFLGPLRGRDPDLATVCSGYLANPMIQPRCSLLPLASIAAFLAGGDPEAAWSDACGARLTFAQACDGAHPRALVAALTGDGDAASWVDSLGALRAWMLQAASCEAPGLEGEADRWLDQVHREASVGMTAVRLLERLRPNAHRVPAHGDVAAATQLAMALALTWPAVQRSDVSVMGPRTSFRPILSQTEDGEWRFHRASLEEDHNAIDALVRLALGELDRAGDPSRR